MVDLAKNLGVQKMILVINKVLPEDNLTAIEQAVAMNCQDQRSQILPFSMTMMRIGNESTFGLDYPEHPLTEALQNIVSQISE
jgi:MinD-like ATPase involved in chromosome partitioning or flagellar assembly